MNHITTLPNTRRVTVASLLIFGAAHAGVSAGSLAHPEGYTAMSMKDDLAHRSPDIHWPDGFEPVRADLFAHNDLIINASCERVWTVFRWTTFGLAIESKVHEYVLNQRLGWYWSPRAPWAMS